jgi:hypothetical protein
VGTGWRCGRRWVWALSDRQHLRPIPCKGRQGVHAVPLEVSDLVEARLCRVTAQTIWEHLRVGMSLERVLTKLPEWAHPWCDAVAADLQASFTRMAGEVAELATAGDTSPGPYQAHVEDALAGNTARMAQRLWAQLHPSPEIPVRVA